MMSFPNARRSEHGNVTGRPRGVAVAFLLLLLATPGRAASPRIRPPDDLPCPREELSLYAGGVSQYERRKDALAFTVDTEWDTREHVQVTDSSDGPLIRKLRIDGRPFTTKDWPAIERAEGRLRDGIRVRVWLCRKGSTPAVEIVDWLLPPSE